MTEKTKFDAFLAAKNYDGAIAWAETAISTNPSLEGDADLCRRLGQAYVLRAKQPSTASPERDYSLAIDSFKKALKAKSSDPSTLRQLAAAHILRGNLHFEAGILALALTDYTDAIDLNPLNPETYFKRALVYQKKNESELSRKDYTAAAELAPPR